MTRTDLYAILALSKGASEAEIKQAYRRLAFATHPDTNPDNPDAREAFEAVSKAYAILSNTALRGEYDRTGKVPGLAADTLEAQALSAINQLLGQVLRVDADPLSIDLIPQMRSCLQDEITNIEKQQHVLTRAKMRAEKLQKRFKPKKKDQENSLASSMDWHLKQIAAELIPVEEGLKVLKKAYDMLGQYTCVGDIPPAISYTSTTTTFLWSTSAHLRGR